MNTQTSAQTKREVLTKLRGAHARAGRLYKPQRLDPAVSLLGYHPARPPAVTPRINPLCAGAPRQLIHHCQPAGRSKARDVRQPEPMTKAHNPRTTKRGGHSLQ
jgi:hypothetical protein